MYPIVRSTPGLIIVSSGLTDVGRRRRINQDALVADPHLDLDAVADGLGGAAGGEVAAVTALTRLEQAVREVPQEDRLRVSPTGQQIGWLARLSRAVELCKEAVLARARVDEGLEGMGSTLDVMLVRGSTAFLAHVGDGRIYGLRRGVLTQLTVDHRLAQHLIERGLLTPEQAARHPRRNLLTRALGQDPCAPVDTMLLELEPGDRILLCSDGLYEEVPGERIQAILAGPVALAAEALVQAALDRGAPDNVTALVIGVSEAQARPMAEAA